MVGVARRVSVAASALALSVLFVSPVFGQAKPATPTTSAPAAPAKWVPPMKGIATIEVIRGTGKRNMKTNDVETLLKIRNTSKGSIALLGIEEFWYNQKREIVSGDSQKVKRLINPGEIVEITMKSPWKEGLYTSQYTFNHANGKIEAKSVKKFE
jgi:hypothetical protein